MLDSHHITIDVEVPVAQEEETAALLHKLIGAALTAEGVSLSCEINVLLTDDTGMQEINREQRAIDAPTDVLSFPMLDLKPGQALKKSWADPGTGLIALGDMVLNLDRMREQAEEFGHPMHRELSYLVVHSVLHLLGYDHLDEGSEKAKMRTREEVVLADVGIDRAP